MSEIFHEPIRAHRLDQKLIRDTTGDEPRPPRMETGGAGYQLQIADHLVDRGRLVERNVEHVAGA